ncbi:C45 family autoproteolytic acyltransferase/hydolase [Macrococcus sp. DPC7161]|uniref:C45 family autoproteolytic acyltransferase/hydolase n=1 Tax=Macrococcus sp. DPC7161 TaxID=2507060 RepID=UPI001F0BFADF|nr:C45 family autoproteolytic acyltransferase/hydolase [Macrococcus sp. DPC7161]
MSESEIIQHVKSDITYFSGNHYDFGLYQSEWIKQTLMMKNRERDWRIRRPRFDIDVEATKAAYNQFAPYIWDELMGLQDGLKMDLHNVLLNFGHYRVYQKPSGCSVFTTEDYLVRNYDYHPSTYDGRITYFEPTDGGIPTLAPVSRITGRMDGINLQGLAMGYNFMHRKVPGDGFVCFMIGRLILETCDSVEMAVDLLKEIPHRASFSYILLDKSGVTKIVEATPRDVIVRDHHYCTNHFEVLTHENRRYLEESQSRMHHLTNQVNDTLTLDEAFHIMNHPDKGIFCDNYASWSGTIHTTAYEPKKLAMHITLGQGKRYTLSLKDFHQGKLPEFTAIEGTLRTQLTFASE